MDILKFITDNATNVALFAALPVITLVLSKVIPIIQNKIQLMIANWKRDLNQWVEIKLQDPLLREYVLGQITLAEKVLKGKNGQAKFEFVKKKILEKCPDFLDDAVEKIIQTIYDSTVKEVGIE